MRRSKKSSSESTTDITKESKVAVFVTTCIVVVIKAFLLLIAFLLPTQLVLIGIVPFLSAYFLTNQATVNAMDLVSMYTVAGISLFAWYYIFKALKKVALSLSAKAESWIRNGHIPSVEKVD